MPALFRSNEGFDAAAYRRELADHFPGSSFGCLWDVNAQTLSDLEEGLGRGAEEDIQQVLTSNPYLLQYAVAQSGHHGIWAFPKATIKPPGCDGSTGLIPDYLIVTRSSLGYFWNVVELKKFDASFSNKKGDGFSPEGNKAVAQCARYLAHFQEYIESVRSNIMVGELVQPSGAILLIGDSDAENEHQCKFRSDYVRNNSRIDVVSYRRIISGLRSDLAVRGITIKY